MKNERAASRPIGRAARRSGPLRVGLAAAALVAGTFTGISPATAQGAVGSTNPAGIEVGPPSWARGNAALAALGDRLPAVARAYGFETRQLESMFLYDETLVVDDNDELLYTDHAPLGEEVVVGIEGDGPAAAPATTDPVFSLESRPGADHTIYLDFDGHVTSGTSWLSGAEIVSPPYDIDGAPDSWNATELGRIRTTWEAVAEDFAPFDINVTTSEPSADALSRIDSNDTTWGTRVVFTDDTAGLCGCGGIAYIGSFDDRLDEPVFVFNSSLSGIVEAATHEVGHAMLLAHDGQGASTYYNGHGSGETSWGPIMGAAYNRNVTQWSAGDYFGSTNIGADANYGRGADDLAILSSATNGNGFGYRIDDHGDGLATATVATAGELNGVISTTTDIDVFSVSTGSTLSVVVEPHPANPNLDTHLRILDGAGQVVATADDPTSLSSTIDLQGLTPGIHYVVVDGVGWGSPLSSTLVGWTGYGSLGQYSVTVTADQGPVDTEAPAPPSGLRAEASSGTQVSVSWAPNGESDLASYSLLRSENGTNFEAVANLASNDTTYIDNALTGATSYTYALTATDFSGNVSAASSSVTVTTETPTIEPDSVVLDTPRAGTVTGSFEATWVLDGASQTIAEVSSGGKPRDRHDLAEHLWTFDATGGNQILEIDAEVFDGGDADTGFEFEWSTSTSGPWTALTTLRSGASTGAFDLGSVSGPVHVRVIDNDRTARNRSFDSLAIDLLRLSGGAPVTDAPALVTGPQPADGSSGVALDAALSWSPAEGAASYEATLFVDGLEVFSTTTNTTTIGVNGLEPETTYEWRVDASNEIGTTTGTTWSFTTAADASTVTVSSLTEETVSAQRGTKRAEATVTVVDSNGAPVAGASVEVQISGGVNETISGTTNASGTVVLTSSGAAKKLTFSTCVVSLNAAGLSPVASSFDC